MAAQTNSDLEANILANLDDREAHLVYGDWLQSQGDPRGELVTVQSKLSHNAVGDPALVAREKELLAAHGSEWLGELAKLSSQDFAATWAYGFLRAVRIGPPTDEYATSEIDFPDTLAKLARLPGTQFLQELVIGAFQYDDYPQSWSDCIAAIVEHGIPRNLAALELNCGGMFDISGTELGDLSAAYPRLTRLRELRIQMGGMMFGSIELPELRAIEITTGGLTKDNLASFRAASWPKLEKLALCIGETGNNYGCNVELEDMRWIFAAENLANVRHLALANSSLSDQIAMELATSKILGQLETLDLSQGTLSDEGADVILAVPEFKRLRAIDLSHSYISPKLRAELAKLGPVINLADPQEGGPDDRYVQISE